MSYTILNKGIEEEIPYTIVGNTSLLESFDVTLTGKGIKAICEKMDIDEYLQIKVFNDHTEFIIN